MGTHTKRPSPPPGEAGRKRKPAPPAPRPSQDHMGAHLNGPANGPGGGLGGEVNQILDSIRRVVRVLRVSSRAAEKQVGLSAAQLFVLHTLADRPASSINELAELTRTH